MPEDLNQNQNTDIDKALKEFEAQNSAETVNQAAGDDIPDISNLKNPTSSKMVGWIIKYSGGVIKEERQAEYILLGVAVIFILTSLYLFFGDNIQKKTPVKTIKKVNVMPVNQ